MYDKEVQRYRKLTCNNWSGEILPERLKVLSHANGNLDNNNCGYVKRHLILRWLIQFNLYHWQPRGFCIHYCVTYSGGDPKVKKLKLISSPAFLSLQASIQVQRRCGGIEGESGVTQIKGRNYKPFGIKKKRTDYNFRQLCGRETSLGRWLYLIFCTYIRYTKYNYAEIC